MAGECEYSRKTSETSNAQSLQGRVFVYLIPFLSASDFLALTSLNSFFHNFRVSSSLFTEWQVPVTSPLHNDAFDLSRSSLIESLLQKKLAATGRDRLLLEVAIASPLGAVLASRLVGINLVLFSHADRTLTIWEWVNSRPVIHKSLEVDGKILDLKLRPGKIGIVSPAGVQINHYSWEKLLAADVHSETYLSVQLVTSGVMDFYEVQHLIVAILNGCIYVFDEKLTVLHSFKDSNWFIMPGGMIQAHESLPYFWLVCMNKLFIFNATGSFKKPVLSFDIPMLVAFKARPVYVCTTEKPRCFLMLLNMTDSYTGDLYATSKLLTRRASDFSVCRDLILTLSLEEGAVLIFQATSNGVLLQRSLQLNRSLVRPLLVVQEQRLLLIGQIPNATVVLFTDYSGTEFHRYRVSDVEVENVTDHGNRLLLLGRASNLPFIGVLHCLKTTTEKARIKLLVENVKSKLVSKVGACNNEGEERKQKMFEERREAKRVRQRAKREHEELRDSRFWKNSIKQAKTLEDLLLEDFSLC